MKSVAELLEMPEGELLDYVQSRSPEARAALLAELIENQAGRPKVSGDRLPSRVVDVTSFRNP